MRARRLKEVLRAEKTCVKAYREETYRRYDPICYCEWEERARVRAQAVHSKESRKYHRSRDHLDARNT